MSSRKATDIIHRCGPRSLCACSLRQDCGPFWTLGLEVWCWTLKSKLQHRQHKATPRTAKFPSLSRTELSNPSNPHPLKFFTGTYSTPQPEKNADRNCSRNTSRSDKNQNSASNKEYPNTTVTHITKESISGNNNANQAVNG